MISKKQYQNFTKPERAFYKSWVKRYPDLHPNFYDHHIGALNYRWDFIWQISACSGVAVEVQGGIYSIGKSGHNSGNGIVRDCDKNNRAQLAGFISILLPSNKVSDAEWHDILYRAIMLKDSDYTHKNDFEHHYQREIIFDDSDSLTSGARGVFDS